MIGQNLKLYLKYRLSQLIDFSKPLGFLTAGAMLISAYYFYGRKVFLYAGLLFFATGAFYIDYLNTIPDATFNQREERKRRYIEEMKREREKNETNKNVQS